MPRSAHGQEPQLLERSDQLAVLNDLLAGGSGRMVLLGGEAGVGKTTLLREFSTEHSGSTRILWGACDALFTPRPLGPLFEITEGTQGELEQLVASEAKPHEVASALLAELGSGKRALLVLEDLHWADEATLDVFRLLARRIESVPALVLASYRDDELERDHPLRLVLGELATSPAVTRLRLEPLSEDAVAQLAEPHGIDPQSLHRLTAGNPFYVTEALEAGTDEIPQTVRDAVLARAMRLAPEARSLLEAVAVVTPQAELWLLEQLAGDSFDRVEDCLASGMLTSVPHGVAFRHELARIAVEESLTPDRALALNQRALSALADPPSGTPDLARLAHHAEAAGDRPAVLRFAPQAAARAASLGAHRESAAQYQRALRFADGEPPETRADLLERCSQECYLSSQLEEAVATGERALALRRELADREKEAASLRALSQMLSFAGRSEEGRQRVLEAIALLEQLPPGAELARAYATLAQRCVNWDDVNGALEWGNRGLALAEELDDPAILVHLLTTIGVAEFRIGAPEGGERLERALEMARANDLEDGIGRVYLNLSMQCLRRRRFAEAAAWQTQGLEYCEERGLDYWAICLVAGRAWVHLAHGRWTEAGDDADTVVRRQLDARVAKSLALMVRGVVRARRGDPDVWPSLEQGLAVARPTAELMQIEPLVAGTAEAAWLEGQPEKASVEVEKALALALATGATWELGELVSWCRRLGLATDVEPPLDAGPYALTLAGDPAGAAVAWNELGCAYDAALALADSDDEGDLRNALASFQQLGARPAAAIVTRRLRGRGARDLPQGPRKATRANTAGLTPRELEVLELLTEGLRNQDIAERLFVAEKTVDHHVSAILRKLDAKTRAEAGVKAIRLGIAFEDR